MQPRVNQWTTLGWDKMEVVGAAKETDANDLLKLGLGINF